MILVIIIGLFIALWIFTMSLEMKAMNIEAINKYTQIRKDIEMMPQYWKWKQEIFQTQGRICYKCSSKEDLQIHHKTSFYSILKQNNISSKEEAMKCAELWNTNNGQVLCKICHDTMKSSINYNKHNDLKNEKTIQ